MYEIQEYGRRNRAFGPIAKRNEEWKNEQKRKNISENEKKDKKRCLTL
jgi:hypothetical protein